MNKREITKNILDLEYRKELQKQNNILLMGTTSLLPLIISFIWYQERWAFGLALTFSIAVISFFEYKKSERRLNGILNKIKEI